MLNQKSLCVSSLSKRNICNVLRNAECIRLKLSGNIEGCIKNSCEGIQPSNAVFTCPPSKKIEKNFETVILFKII